MKISKNQYLGTFATVVLLLAILRLCFPQVAGQLDRDNPDDLAQNIERGVGQGDQEQAQDDKQKSLEQARALQEKAAKEQMYTVRCHVNVIYAGEPDKVVTAITKMGITPVMDSYNMPVQFWSSIPGNEAGLAFSEYMTIELSAALCLGIYEGFEPGIPGGVLKMSDRQRLTPLSFDIQEKAMDLALIENYNVFILGPSGAGKC